MIKTFRGILADGGQDRIRLQTPQGKVGYQIVNFRIITQHPASVAVEGVYKITKTELTTIDATIDFTFPDLLAVGFYTANTSPTNPHVEDIIFDNQIFNQDIFISYKDAYGSTEPGNYYIELETIPLTEMGAEYTTIKDLRANA